MKEQEIKKRHAIDTEPNKLDSDMKQMKQWADESRKKEIANSADSKPNSADYKTVLKQTKESDNKEAVKKKAQPVSSAAKKTSSNTASQKEASKNPSVKKHSPVVKNSKPVAKGNDKKQKDGDRKPNYLLWVTVIIIAIPCLILLYIFIGSRESSSEPVEGSRFKNALDPKITEEDLEALKTSLTFEGAEAVEINLKSATLRININAKDDLNQEAIKKLMSDAYDKVNEKLPIDKYFTNKENADQVVKMYDLEISAYNYIPKNEEEKKGQIHLSRVKNSSADKPVDDVLSTPKDKQSADEILNPDTSNPPTNDNKEQTEGE